MRPKFEGHPPKARQECLPCRAQKETLAEHTNGTISAIFQKISQLFFGFLLHVLDACARAVVIVVVLVQGTHNEIVTYLVG